MTNAEQPFMITRAFNAPRRLVFETLTEARHLAQWWGPKGFTMENIKLELKPGGLFLYSMRSPDGKEMWGRFVYREIVVPERIVFVNSFSDKDGNIVPNAYLPDFPKEILNELTLDEQDGKTLLTMKGHPINATAEEIATFEKMRAGMNQGFAGTFEQLDNYLVKLQK